MRDRSERTTARSRLGSLHKNWNQHAAVSYTTVDNSTVTRAELQLLQHVFTEWRSRLKSYIKGSNCKHNIFAIRSQEATQRDLGFDRDNTELHSARAEYQIVSIECHIVRAYDTTSWNTIS